MSSATQLSNFGYSSMGHGRSDYEGYYGVDLNKPRYGYHCHDFYEFFLHISGARDFGVDNEMYLLQPNQLVIVPPFHMHGLMWDQVLPRYERAFLYCSADYLATIGAGQIDLAHLFSEKLKGKGCLIYNLSEETASECSEYMKRSWQTAKSSLPWIISGISPIFFPSSGSFWIRCRIFLPSSRMPP